MEDSYYGNFYKKKKYVRKKKKICATVTATTEV